MKIQVDFILERETKGAIRYSEVDGKNKPLEITEGATIGKLYVRKSALGEKRPMRLHVEITERT